ncbi:MAG TPA: PVC-type heme-binding CxxCH protein [Cyclobacteriaceae bacterium]
MSHILNPLPHRILVFIVLLLFVQCKKNSTDNEIAGDSDVTMIGDFQIARGFTIELIAAEPLIRDPVDMEIDEFGRLYVVEMPGYPLDVGGSGKIKLLSDTDGDGVMDSATVFAENLLLPTGIMRWKRGVIVTDAPYVFYLEDANNDGRAEVMDTLLTGFALTNPQHKVNNPVYGPDNWIYLAHEGAVSTDYYQDIFGDEGTEIFYPDYPDAPRLRSNAGGRSVRFRPDRRQLEMLASHTQFGQTFDLWGNHFLVWNANHIYHEVIAARYLERNPNLLVSSSTQSLSDHGDAAEVFPITVNPQHELLTDVGVMTSACGLITYLGGAFPPPYDEKVTFVAEPVSNLVHADKVTPKGATFEASRMFENTEFLASRDVKFRPVNLYVGPDGALYVVDYYRQIIEHPEWMDEETVRSGTLYTDSDKGRIYRIAPEGAPKPSWINNINLGRASADELISTLKHPNYWWRINAQRLLVDRNDANLIPALAEMCMDPESPLGRLHALWTLEGMQALNTEIILQALSDSVAGIRENAMRLAELHLGENPELDSALINMKDDPDPRVRYQLLLTLGYIDSPEAATARSAILFRDIEDPWIRTAALSASNPDVSGTLNAMLSQYRADIPGYAGMIRQLGSLVATSGEDNALHDLLVRATAAGSDSYNGLDAALQGIAEGWERKRPRRALAVRDQQLLASACLNHPVITIRQASLRLLKASATHDAASIRSTLQKAAVIAFDESANGGERAVAIDMLTLGNPAPHTDRLIQLVTPNQELSVSLAAIRTLETLRSDDFASYLVSNWAILTPQLKDAAVRVLMTSHNATAMLLDGIASGTIQTSDVSWPRKVRLMEHEDFELRKKARDLFTRDDSEAVTAKYQSALIATGDPAKGRDIFQKNCAICHQVRGKDGVNIGPDLGTVHNWSKQAILASILAPNLAISSGYETWSATLESGEIVEGIIASETGSAITLRNAAGVDRTISRQDIRSFKAVSMSLMPEGLEGQISVEEMADLLAFLKGNTFQ